MRNHAARPDVVQAPVNGRQETHALFDIRPCGGIGEPLNGLDCYILCGHIGNIVVNRFQINLYYPFRTLRIMIGAERDVSLMRLLELLLRASLRMHQEGV